MKHKALWILLIAEAVLCILLRILQTKVAGAFSAAMAFPFEQLGLLLRALSLSGWVGNIAAFALYIAVSLVPVAALLLLRKKHGFHREDGSLVLLSAVLFAVLYLMINPALISLIFGGTAGQAVGKAILGGTVYAVLCGYLVLKTLRLFFAGSTEKLRKYMAVLLGLLNLLFVYAIFGACFGKLLDSFATLRAGNTISGPLESVLGLPGAGEHPLGVSYAFLILQFMIDALPYVLDVIVVFAALRLLDALCFDRYSQESVDLAARLSRLCGAALAATVLANIAFNLLQLLFAKTLLVINSSVQIPVISIAFVLAVLLLARFVAENKQLKAENDLYI